MPTGKRLLLWSQVEARYTTRAGRAQKPITGVPIVTGRGGQVDSVIARDLFSILLVDCVIDPSVQTGDIYPNRNRGLMP